MHVGIIGGGWIVQKAYLPVLLRKFKPMEIHLFDSDKECRYLLEKKFSIYTYGNLSDFLEASFSVAIVATPNNTHFFYSKLLMETGRNVLCEKPITLNIDEYNTLLDIESKKKVRFMPAYVNRYRPEIIFLINYIKKGNIGNVTSIYGKWIRGKGIPLSRKWLTNREISGGGVLIDLGPHVLDICLGIMPLEEFEISQVHFDYCNKPSEYAATWVEKKPSHELICNMEVETYAKLKAISNGKRILNIEVSWVSESKYDITNFKIIGEKKSIELCTLFGFSNNTKYKKIVLSEISGPELMSWKFNYELPYNAFADLVNSFFLNLQMKENIVNSNLHEIQNIKLIEDAYIKEGLN